MTKCNLQIIKYEDKSSNGFDRTRFECRLTDGTAKWMSSFRTNDKERELVQKLKDNINKVISVDITQKPNKNDSDKPFFNITAFHGAVELTNEGFSVPLVDKEVLAKNAQRIAGIPPIVKLSGEEFAKVARKAITGSAYEKDPVGLAVEVFCSIFGATDKDNNRVNSDNTMIQAIQLVKQAQEAFS